MTDGLLENIIQLEKQIQTEVAAEKERAAAWQAREVAAMQDALAAARVDQEQRRRQLLAEKQAEVECQGAAMEAASSAWCERLACLDEAALRNVLQRRLAAILPGGDHDHPHGKG